MSQDRSRTEVFKLRVTREERKLIESLARRDGLSASDVVRRVIHAEARRINRQDAK